jgi:ATP-binding cassette subfamily B (MDR/TAP) protein 1
MGGGGNQPTGVALEDSKHSRASDGDKKEKKKTEAAPQASMAETLDFVFQCGTRVTFIFLIGCFAGFCNGLVYPALAYLFSTSFSDLAGASSEGGLDNVRTLAFNFLYVGSYALIMGVFQTWCFEIVAYHATQNLRLQWFKALLRQDTAYFDVHSASGIAGQVGPSSNKYRRGVGRKFGEGIQFLTTGIGGVACE